MTEAEWFAATDPTPMRAFIRAKASDRQLRLFVCACIRVVWLHSKGGDEVTADIVKVSRRCRTGR